MCVSLITGSGSIPHVTTSNGFHAYLQAELPIDYKNLSHFIMCLVQCLSKSHLVAAIAVWYFKRNAVSTFSTWLLNTFRSYEK